MDWLVKHKTLVREIVISCARDSPRSRLTHELTNPACSPVSFQSNRETERRCFMRSHSDLRNSSKERIGFVLFAIFIGSVVWLTDSSASKLARSMDSEAAFVAAKAPQKDQGTNVGQ